MKIKNSICYKKFSIIIVLPVVIVLLVLFLVSCKNKTSGDNLETSGTYIASQETEIEASDNNESFKRSDGSQTDSTESTSLQTDVSILSEASVWGPLKLCSGNIEKLYIYKNTAVGSVSYNVGKQSEGTLIYALDIRNGVMMGTAEIPGRCYAVDISDRYIFTWVKEGINVYDLKDSFKLAQTFYYDNNGERVEWVSNIGSFLFVENSVESDYLIDKETLTEKQLNIDSDDFIYYLLYPDCLIGDPNAFSDSSLDDAAIYNFKTNQIIGNVDSIKLSKIFAWDFKKNLLFVNDKDNIEVVNCTNGNVFENIRISESEIDSIISNILNYKDYYSGGTYRLNTITDFLLSENNAYFFNGNENAYIFDYNDRELYRLYDSEILGEFSNIIFYKKGNNLGAIQNFTNNIWEKEKPKDFIVSENPAFSQYSILWLCQNFNEYGAIYQWDYMSGSYLNYTEFTGYQVEILSERPLILALRNKEEGINGVWDIVCLDNSKLPFNLTCDIEIEVSPENIYANTNPAEFDCILKNIPEGIPVNEILYEWDFGDGTKDTGKQTSHLYTKSGNYNVSVLVKLGPSLNSFTETTEVAILESLSGMILTATPTRYTEDGLVFDFVCTPEDPWKFPIVEWDFGDETTGGNATVVSHPYPPGTYKVTAIAYNEDKSLSLKKEINIISGFPDFRVTYSELSGYTLHKVDFECVTEDNEFPETLGLACYWKLGDNTFTNDKNGTKKLEFYNPGNYTLILEVKDPAMRLAYQESFNITVYPPEINTENSGRRIISKSQIFLHDNDIEEYDIDKDGINQYWEDYAMNVLNPCFELDEGEDWLKYNYIDEELPQTLLQELRDSLGDNIDNLLQGNAESDIPWEHFLQDKAGSKIEENLLDLYYTLPDSHKVVNYVIISPHESKLNQQYILFTYGICWSKDYGRYDFYPHNGDIEKVVMAWKIIDDYTLELDEVFTSAHSNGDMDHSGVWPAFGERTWTCAVAKSPDIDEITGYLKFISYNSNLDILKFYVSEDKHAIYPTVACGEGAQLAPYEAEDVGSEGWYLYRFPCFNILDEYTPIIDDIGDLFPYENIWSGNFYNPEKFVGGLLDPYIILNLPYINYSNAPGKIGGSLSGIPKKLEFILNNPFLDDF